MFERRSALLGFISRVLDLSLTALAFPLAYWVRMRVLTRVVGSEVVRPAIYPFHAYWPLFLGILALWFLAGHFLRIYRDIEIRNRQQLVGDAAKMVVLGLIGLNAALYFVRAIAPRQRQPAHSARINRLVMLEASIPSSNSGIS